MADTERAGDQRVTPGLLGQPRLRIDQYESEIGGRGAGRHIAGVLLMAGRVGDNEFALLGREKPIGEINSDLLLSFSRQPVEQQRKIEFIVSATMVTGVLTQRLDL